MLTTKTLASAVTLAAAAASSSVYAQEQRSSVDCFNELRSLLQRDTLALFLAMTPTKQNKKPQRSLRNQTGVRDLKQATGSSFGEVAPTVGRRGDEIADLKEAFLQELTSIQANLFNPEYDDLEKSYECMGVSALRVYRTYVPE
ncbi:hypothetical protein FI667_g3093, partial [Globisporangium splendens]